VQRAGSSKNSAFQKENANPAAPLRGRSGKYA
jgi:hypothetical protein